MNDKTKVAAGVELSPKEIAHAQHEGALEYVKEAGARAMAVDTGTTSNFEAAAERQAKQVPADFQSTFFAPLLDLPVDELESRLTNHKDPHPVGSDNARGLLALERSGKNRTDYVKMLCNVIGVKSPLEVTSAGPAWTNDTSAITPL